jgi:hypothetical protein
MKIYDLDLLNIINKDYVFLKLFSTLNTQLKSNKINTDYVHSIL